MMPFLHAEFPLMKTSQRPAFSKEKPNFSEEKRLWRKGFKAVIGVDEVGRGSWAGPVVAAAVVFSFARGPVGFHPHPTSSLPASWRVSAGARWGSPAPATPRLSTSKCTMREFLNLGINDSKALGSQKRGKLAEIIRECSAWSVAEVGVGVINKVGIGKATEMAMRKAIDGLWQMAYGKWNKNNHTLSAIRQKPFVLVDGFHVRYLRGLGLKNQKAIIRGDQKSISIASASILAKVYRDKLMKKLSKKYPQYGWGRNKGYGTRGHQKAILEYGITRLHRKQFVETFLRKRKKGSE